ncbi:hypothetical protein [Limnohabitans sp. Rim8]|uniref:hypothetical protein n=1 Tax=Limnohabitans sp. Rim8 TaxID=1100718 RepID=UPI0033069225
MIDPEVLSYSTVDQFIETRSSIGAEDAVVTHFISGKGFQCGFESSRNDSFLNPINLLQQSNHECFTFSDSNEFVANSHESKLGFIGFKFHLKIRLHCAKCKHLYTDVLGDCFRASDLQTTESCSIGGRQIKGKKVHKMSELMVLDFGAGIVPFSIAISGSEHVINMCFLFNSLKVYG